MHVSLHTDGGSRGNPGPAAAGIVLVRADTRQPLREQGILLGEATNNVAEYQGLIRGIEAAIELGATQLAIHCDSELIVKQVKGEYKVKHADMLPLHRKVLQLLGRVPQWTLRHIPRAQNARADQLVNAALDAGIDVDYT